MAPSMVDVTHQLSCCVCEESLETVGSLHYHQMCYHTTEELSLALLTLKGLKLLVGDLENSTSNEDVVLRTGLAKYPHFLLNKNCNHVDSDSESIATVESSKLQGAITTLNGDNIIVPVVRIFRRNNPSRKNSNKDNIHDEFSESTTVTPLREKKQKTKLALREKNKDNISVGLTHSFIQKDVFLRSESVEKCVEKQMGNLVLNCYSDDSNTVSGKNGDNSDTDSDVEVRVNPNSRLRSNVEGCAIKTLDENFSSVFVKNEFAAASDTQLLTVDMECTEDDNNGKVSPLHKASSCSSPSSVDSFLSPDNSPRPEHHIRAIISRLPNIINPESAHNSSVESQGRRTSRKKQRTPRRYVNDNYVLPSPVSKHHHSEVLYDYGKGQQSCNKDTEQFQDFFVPSVTFESGIDAECSTNPLDISEKEVQTTTTNPSDDDSGIQVDEQEKNLKKTTVEERETQTGLISVTTQRLAAYRKPQGRKLESRRARELANVFSESAIKKCGTDTASTSKILVSSLPLSRFNCSAGDMRENLVPQAEGKMKMLSRSLMKIYPRGMTDRRFFCEPCGKGYKKKSHLERHVRVHTGERPFQCPHCEKRFAVRSILKQHVRTHTGEKPYCCTICQQRFPQKSGLMTHTMLHTGKPFKCDRCDKAFVSNHKLLQHLKNHGGPRKYICPTCATEFFTEGALLQHEQTHSRRNVLLCMICGESFQKETLLKLHLDQHLQKFNSVDTSV